jgi:hypothetical protein
VPRLLTPGQNDVFGFWHMPGPLGNRKMTANSQTLGLLEVAPYSQALHHLVESRTGQPQFAGCL